jgi:hypothetical protein
MRTAVGIDYDLSRSDIQSLLAGFLTGAVGVTLGTRLMDLDDLPSACRTHVRLAAANGRTWAAWVTDRGPIAVCGEYHIEPSKRLFAYLLLTEWWEDLSGHHSMWCYCDPKRLTEWTFGRGRDTDTPWPASRK